ncbi:CocE/NonD family hydrolase C-terminal non-catalytic domain-containing protein [Nocardia sp. GAS34]|uniref:CocE/NonD family hydrolase C-terminal non-catalytic domain-containing protein n=1 Tax=unclassified Nocardia TaxID=2637762 RepID=UPI003D1C89CE
MSGAQRLGCERIRCATVQLWPTAYRFKRGHRIRVQVSSGAFPRYAATTGPGSHTLRRPPGWLPSKPCTTIPHTHRQ